jgi:hypothetical protein
MIDAHVKILNELKQEAVPYVSGTAPRMPSRPFTAICADAARAIELLSQPNDFDTYMHRQTETKLARAESNAASINVELRLMRERCAELMSQHEPLAGLGVDRELVRQVLHYVQCGRLK